MFRVSFIDDKKEFAEFDNINTAINVAIEQADLYHRSMEIRKVIGKRTYFVIGVTPYKNNRFAA